MNYFSFLDLNLSFNIDLALLESAYFAAQRQFHPDRFAGKPDSERLAAAGKSADINKAYQTLNDPLKRAQYLLSLSGVTVGTDHDSVKPTHELLMEVMELRETPPAAETLAKMRQKSIKRIGQFFVQNNWPAMAHETLRLGYLVKI